MNSKIAGIALMIIGILMLVYTGFNYVTTKKVVDVGPIQINQKTDHPVSWPPAIGAVLLVGGIIIVSRGKKR